MSLTAEFKNKGTRVVYSGEGYRFRFNREANAFLTTLVVKPVHLKILFNSTGMKPKDLKDLMIMDWFEEENIHNTKEK